MQNEIRILMVEDTPLDAELTEHEFRKEGIPFQIKRVETKESFEQALLDFRPSIIFSDIQLPVFDGFSALAIAQEKSPHIPFIFVSGKIGEETAVKAGKQGATDYVHKNNLSKVVSVTLRALKESSQNTQLIESQQMSEFLAAVVESSSDSIIGLTFDGLITSWNKGAQEIYGYALDEVIGKSITIIQPSEKIEEFKGIMLRIKNGEYITNFQSQRRTKAGLIIEIISTISPVKKSNGEIVGISVITRDITPSKKMQAELDKKRLELIESEERFRQTTENLREIVWLVAKDWSKMLYINSAYTEIFGRSLEEIYANPVSFIEAIHQEDRPRVLKAVEEQKTSGKYEVEYRIVQPDGKIRWIYARAFPIKNAEGEVFRMAGIAEDITRQRNSEMALMETQRKLIHTEKLAAIGQLSAGVAHEIKNPLGIITLSIEQLKSEIKDLDEDKAMYIEMIQEATERANRVVVELLNYSRTSELKLEPISIEKILDHSVFLLKNATKLKNISIHCQYYQEKILSVNGDKALLEQVFFNLIANAIDAIEKEGSITIKTYAGTSKETKPQVVIEIIDTGTGMPPEVARRIFEPFYTTKPQGKGTGLGLSIVDTILTQHKGTIRVESKEGVGTTFIIALPQIC